MVYEKQAWECNDVITADKLNHMEDGIEACGNVEAIKLGTFHGSGYNIGGSVNYWAGGGTLDGSQSLADLVGDKTVVNLEFRVPNPDTGQEAFLGEAYVGSGSAHHLSLATVSRSLYSEITSLAVYGLACNVSTSTVDVYAICI